jgi:hypothetical protein
MKSPNDWEADIQGKHYTTKNSILLAQGDDRYRRKHETIDRNISLYRSPEGEFFKVTLSKSQSDRNKLEILEPVEALKLFGSLTERYVDLEDAFPNIGTTNSE